MPISRPPKQAYHLLAVLSIGPKERTLKVDLKVDLPEIRDLRGA